MLFRSLRWVLVTPLRSLRQAGLASDGSAEHDAALDVAFAGTAYMLDGF